MKQVHTILRLFKPGKMVENKRESLFSSPVAHQAGAYPDFCSASRLGVFLLHLDGMLVLCRATPAFNFNRAEWREVL